MRPRAGLAGALAFGAVLAACLWAVQQRPAPPRLTARAAPAGPCTPGSRFTSFAPPALPGEWQGDHGFFAIPGTLELEFCRSGTLSFRARGDLADNGGPPLLVTQTDQGQTQRLVADPVDIRLRVGPSGRAVLAFPNDETNAAYRILTLERLAVTGKTDCTSVLRRGTTRQPFDGAVTGAVYDLEGQILEPCQAGQLYLTVSGPSVDGAGPRLRVVQSGKVLLEREIAGRASFQMPLGSTAPVRLSVVNFLALEVKYRNLFIEDLKFSPAGGGAQ